jgi:probable rRNA maturation factor
MQSGLRQSRAGLVIFLVILQKKVAGLTEGMVERFLLRARRAAGLRQAANVLVASSAVLRSLNRQFRGKDKATDVLSFPPSSLILKNGKKRKFAGDIAISADVAAENAVRFGHSPAEEVKILALHGILHLAGFDHERDNEEMARKEARLRHVLKLPSVLTERAQPAKKIEQSRRKPPKTRTRRKA